jgi:hypothetical protein
VKLFCASHILLAVFSLFSILPLLADSQLAHSQYISSDNGGSSNANSAIPPQVLYYRCQFLNITEQNCSEASIEQKEIDLTAAYQSYQESQLTIGNIATIGTAAAAIIITVLAAVYLSKTKLRFVHKSIMFWTGIVFVVSGIFWIAYFFIDYNNDIYKYTQSLRPQDLFFDASSHPLIGFGNTFYLYVGISLIAAGALMVMFGILLSMEITVKSRR